MSNEQALSIIEGSKEAVNNGGAQFYFNPATLAKGKELGLDGFRWYVLGRGGVLGNVEAPVVEAAFGYFNTGLINKIWSSASEVMAPREAGTRYMECCADFGREHLGDIEGLDAYNIAAEDVIAAANPAGLSLYAGIAAESKVDDAAGRAMQNTAVLRELRGSAHLMAVLASGLTAAQAHAIKRPDDVATFGHESVDIPENGAAMHDAAEALTSQMLIQAYAGLDEAAGASIVETSAAILAAATA